MRFTSSLTTGVGGKLGNFVGLMNKSGQCLRALVTPANPNTSNQQAVRGVFATLAAAWSGTLDAAERLAWAAWAATLTYTSKLGTVYTVSGFNAFIAANTARLQGGLSTIEAGPTVSGFAGFTSPTVTFVHATGKASVAFTNTDDWAGEVGGAMLVRVTPLAILPGVTYYEGPFQYAGKVAGAVTPPTSPATFDVPGGVDVGLQYAVAIRVVRADGRYSAERIFRGIGA